MSMKGSHSSCPFCKGRTLVDDRPQGVIRCSKCTRIVEERRTTLTQHLLWQEQEKPLFIPTNDMKPFELSEPIGGDPYEGTTSFITAYSLLTGEPEAFLTSSSQTIPGELADFERFLGETLFPKYVSSEKMEKTPEKDDKDAAHSPALHDKDKDKEKDKEKHTSFGNNAETRCLAIAYLQVQMIADILDIRFSIRDRSLAIVKDYLKRAETTHRFRNAEALACAALLIACSEFQKHRTLGEVAHIGNVSQRDVIRKLKAIGDVLELSVKERDENPRYRVYVKRFVEKMKLLEKSEAIQRQDRLTGKRESQVIVQYDVLSLAIYIADHVVFVNPYTARTPVSLCAAAIFASCRFEGVPVTLDEIIRETCARPSITKHILFHNLSTNPMSVLPENYEPNISDRMSDLFSAKDLGWTSAGGDHKGSYSQPLASQEVKQTEKHVSSSLTLSQAIEAGPVSDGVGIMVGREEFSPGMMLLSPPDEVDEVVDEAVDDSGVDGDHVDTSLQLQQSHSASLEEVERTEDHVHRRDGVGASGTTDTVGGIGEHAEDSQQSAGSAIDPASFANMLQDALTKVYSQWTGGKEKRGKDEKD